jgi:hypothetical protein
MNTANPDPSLGRNQLPNRSQEQNQQQLRTKEERRPGGETVSGEEETAPDTTQPDPADR